MDHVYVDQEEVSYIDGRGISRIYRLQRDDVGRWFWNALNEGSDSANGPFITRGHAIRAAENWLEND